MGKTRLTDFCFVHPFNLDIYTSKAIKKLIVLVVNFLGGGGVIKTRQILL